MPVTPRPTLDLTVGLPGVGKTTFALELERRTGALRLTPDEWMAPLFGEGMAGGKRDILEGRLVWVASRVLRAGVRVILDFGCWAREERLALRAIAELAGARFELHYLTLPEDERRRRADHRWRHAPEGTFEMTAEDHERFLGEFVPPLPDEFGDGPLPPPPPPFASWPAWACDRWPTLPLLDRADEERAGP